MNDDTMYLWAVADQAGRLHHICKKESTAEYLRDWCQAARVDEWMEFIKGYALPQGYNLMEKAFELCDKFSVVEEEVILN